MAFDVSTATGPEYVPAVGSYLQAVIGVGVISGTTAVIAVPGFSKIVYANASSQTGNAARVSAAAAGSITVTGTDTEAFSYIVIGQARV